MESKEFIYRMDGRGSIGKGHLEAIQGGKALKEEGFSFDVCYTSVLKRAIHTANHVLAQLDEEWIPAIKSYKLNERHYGALQGLNKAETAENMAKNKSKSGGVLLMYDHRH